MDEYKAMHRDGYMFKYNEEYEEEVAFGILIAGYDEQEVIKWILQLKFVCSLISTIIYLPSFIGCRVFNFIDFI